MLTLYETATNAAYRVWHSTPPSWRRVSTGHTRPLSLSLELSSDEDQQLKGRFRRRQRGSRPFLRCTSASSSHLYTPSP